MTIRTQSGKLFECDMCAENPYPPRLYLHLPGTRLATCAAVFANEAELPIDGYPDYRVLQSISDTTDGVNVALRPW